MSKFSNLTKEDLERARRTAAREMAPALQYIRYNNVDFILIGNANTPATSANETSWIAATDQACSVWNLYLNNRVMDTRRNNIMKFKDPGRPNTHTDKDQWEKDSKGEPKNPWGRQLELPLLRLDDDGMPDGQIVVLQASAKPLRAQIGKLVDDFARTLKRPHVTLIVESHPGDQYKSQPEIRITGHSDDESDLLEFDGGFNGDSRVIDGNASTNTGSGDNISTGSAPKKNADMDDDVPF